MNEPQEVTGTLTVTLSEPIHVTGRYYPATREIVFDGEGVEIPLGGTFTLGEIAVSIDEFPQNR
jgi:hypothetical protein